MHFARKLGQHVGSKVHTTKQSGQTLLHELAQKTSRGYCSFCSFFLDIHPSLSCQVVSSSRPTCKYVYPGSLAALVDASTVHHRPRYKDTNNRRLVRTGKQMCHMAGGGGSGNVWGAGRRANGARGGGGGRTRHWELESCTFTPNVIGVRKGMEQAQQYLQVKRGLTAYGRRQPTGTGQKPIASEDVPNAGFLSILRVEVCPCAGSHLHVACVQSSIEKRRRKSSHIAFFQILHTVVSTVSFSSRALVEKKKKKKRTKRNEVQTALRLTAVDLGLSLPSCLRALVFLPIVLVGLSTPSSRSVALFENEISLGDPTNATRVVYVYAVYVNSLACSCRIRWVVHERLFAHCTAVLQSGAHVLFVWLCLCLSVPSAIVSLSQLIRSPIYPSFHPSISLAHATTINTVRRGRSAYWRRFSPPR